MNIYLHIYIQTINVCTTYRMYNNILHTSNHALANVNAAMHHYNVIRSVSFDAVRRCQDVRCVNDCATAEEATVNQ